MDEARAVLQRLERIEALERERAHPQALLAELRELVREAQEWSRAEGDARAARAVENLSESLSASMPASSADTAGPVAPSHA